jgi:hypothetical protein
MRNVSQWVVSFIRSKAVKAVVFGVLVFALVFGGLFVPGSAKIAQACSMVAVYADYHNNKPALYVYSPGRDARIRVADGSHWIKQDLPQNRSGNWAVYYIGTTWRFSQPYPHIFWNDDWRWGVQLC